MKGKKIFRVELHLTTLIYPLYHCCVVIFICKKLLFSELFRKFALHMYLEDTKHHSMVVYCGIIGAVP